MSCSRSKVRAEKQTGGELWEYGTPNPPALPNVKPSTEGGVQLPNFTSVRTILGTKSPVYEFFGRKWESPRAVPIQIVPSAAARNALVSQSSQISPSPRP